MLSEAPQRPYEAIAPLAVRGDPGAPLPYVHEALRREAQALGADAVIRTGQRSGLQRRPAPYDRPDPPLIGNAYPPVLDATQPGGFAPAGRDLRVRGRYYEVEGTAIRYLD